MKITFTILFIILVLISINQYTGWGPADLLPPQTVSVRPISEAELNASVQLVDIDEKIYRATPKSPSKWAAPLYGDQKTAVLINWKGSNRALLSPFKNLLRTPENSAVCKRNIYQLRGSCQTSARDSFKGFLIDNCGKQAVCIINPRTRQAAILTKKDPSYMAAFFERYRNW